MCYRGLWGGGGEREVERGEEDKRRGLWQMTWTLAMRGCTSVHLHAEHLYCSADGQKPAKHNGDLKCRSFCTHARTLAAEGAMAHSRCISSTDASASTNTTSAPWSAKAATLHSASSRLSAWRASVRATIKMSRPSSLHRDGKG